MIRNLKIMGLAMAAFFAFGAISASMASATTTLGQLTSDGPVTLTGEDTGGATGDNAFTLPDDSKVECTHGTYTGHKVLTHAETTEEKKHELLPSGSKTATITPNYTDCHTYPEPDDPPLPTTVTMNGCDYVVHVGAKVSNHTYKAIFDLVCPGNEVVEVHTYAGESHAFTVCTSTIPGQTGLEGGHLRHTTTAEGDDIDAVGTVKGIKFTKHGLCGAAEGNDAELDIDITFKGHNSEGDPTSVTVTDTTV